ncbi:cytochrome P450 [Hysterangium stoloniferum]|nr:cytochrome P450 [Hysterangium stoloniferum]
MDGPNLLLICLVVYVAHLLWAARESIYARFKSTTLPLPPGPTPKWLLGNLLDIPTKSAWIRFTELKNQYDIMSLNVLGKTIIVLNTWDSIFDLLEKRSLRYSNRPVIPMGGELMGLNQSTSLLQYDTTWKKHRTLAKVALNPEAIKKYAPLQAQVSVLFLKSLLDSPEAFAAQLRLAAGRMLMMTTYGLSITSADEDYITEAESLFDKINKVLVPGTYLVDVIPALKHIPVNFPFANFRREALEGRRQLQSVVDRPYQRVKSDMAKGTAPSSIVSDLLNNIEHEYGRMDDDAENTIKWAAGTLYGAGGETIYGTVMTFIIAMILFPEKQALAQAEIDRVTSGERLPDFNDRDSLPYVTALIKETLRWHPTVPLGFPRISDEDEYRGYRIPAGSQVIANVWALSQDEMRHIRPAAFEPERFLQVGLSPPDPHGYVFGFGRRICPGRHLANDSLFILIVSILATFNISKKIDGRGNELPLKYSYTTGFISYPEPFECRLVPRSANARQLILNRALAL